MTIIRNSGGVADGQIFNIGNPASECSVRDLAGKLKALFQQHPDHVDDGVYSDILDMNHEDYYGKGYQDIQARRPSIEKARRLLGWEPKTDLDTALRQTLEYFLLEMKHADNGNQLRNASPARK